MPAARVYLVRHAKAEKHASSERERRLTAEGRAAFEAHVRSHGERLRIARIVTSPFTRAVETAALLAGATGASVEEDDALGSGASSGRELLAIARRAGPGSALVGHNPEIAEAIAVAARHELKVPAGSIAAIDLDEHGATLAWVEAP